MKQLIRTKITSDIDISHVYPNKIDETRYSSKLNLDISAANMLYVI